MINLKQTAEHLEMKQAFFNILNVDQVTKHLLNKHIDRYGINDLFESIHQLPLTNHEMQMIQLVKSITEGISCGNH